MEIIKHSIEQVGGTLKKMAWTAVLESLVTIILGIFLVMWPESVIRVVSYVVGGFLVIKGGYRMVNYFVVKGQNNFFNNDLLFGVISFLVGVAVLVMGEEIVGVFRVVMGVWMIYEGLARMNTAIKMYAAKISAWRYVLIAALLMLLIGVFVTFNDGAVTVLVGWMMVINGVIGIVGDTIFIQYVSTITETLTGKNK